MRAARDGADVLTTFKAERPYPPLTLKGDGLACERGGRLVFDGLSFEARSGDILLVTGPNGSGKSTLLRLLAGLLEKSAGEMSLQGMERQGEVSDYLLYAGHLDAVKGGLSVAENLAFWGALYGDVASGAASGAALDAALAAFALDHLADLPADVLSAGQKRRLGLARLALIERPIWLLDEPSVSLDAENVSRLARLIEAHSARGGIVLAATHADLGLGGARRLDLRGMSSGAAA